MAVLEIEGQRGAALLVAGTAGDQSLEKTLEQSLADPDRLLVLGTMDGVEVGFASARRDQLPGGPIGVIETIYVEPSARQVGVGEVLVEAIVAWCSDRGCVGIDAPALPGSRPAKAFFEDHGFVARLLVMHHRLPVGPVVSDA
jgi:GNAT superfamily N-acetyltransferase